MEFPPESGDMRAFHVESLSSREDEKRREFLDGINLLCTTDDYTNSVNTHMYECADYWVKSMFNLQRPRRANPFPDFLYVHIDPINYCTYIVQLYNMVTCSSPCDRDYDVRTGRTSYS